MPANIEIGLPAELKVVVLLNVLPPAAVAPAIAAAVAIPIRKSKTSHYIIEISYLVT